MNPILEAFVREMNEHLPFNPPAPVDQLVDMAVHFLAHTLSNKLVLIQHFGSTAYTRENMNRPGYQPPHRGSDIDLAVVVTDLSDVNYLRNLCYEHLVLTTLPQNMYSFLLVQQSVYENAHLQGHPGLLVWVAARYFGKTVWP